MTREEQIEQAWFCKACLSSHCYDEKSFKEAAKWADRTMIDRAFEWLKENIDLYSYNAFNTKSGYTEIKLTDEFETAFRQAMEGGAE